MARQTRLEIKWDVVKSFNHADEVIDIIDTRANQMGNRLALEGVEGEVEAEDGPARYRAAVIAGYEHGATMATTREALLRSLDG